ncbi:hypothetical protein QT196_35070 [Streptomyces sp. P9-2B-2]|uniref:hypothetical protein n=1 Tax=Streptomyces TaxID=1883 RepID=UPI00225A4471|nr:MULTISPECIES: hypothetical protein [Streptomyces]MCX4635675.1 hypothetical protein [Streptomyces platensis]WJY42051.1 hypothetical protein QT196_35070 [Streptomyces sp. P9-2B-2]
MTRIITGEFTPPMDTIASIPGSGTVLPATYVHHCHLLEHEDDDLMRPWTIVGSGGQGGGGQGGAKHGGGGHIGGGQGGGYGHADHGGGHGHGH